jgi:twitching motility protein PilT
MKELKDIKFSDMLLAEDGTFLKGVPGQGQRLVPITTIPEIEPSLAEALKELPHELTHVMLQRSHMPAIRHTFEGIMFRVCYADDVGGRSWFLRRIHDRVPSLEELGIPVHMLQYLLSAKKNRGLCLVTGPQSSGKTTVASSLVATRLTLFGGHCVTFERPAEMPLHGQFGEFGRCIQTEVETEEELPSRIMRAHTFASPDIIYIGEIKAAVAAVESLRVALGSNTQMVVATIHGTDIVAALQRLMNFAKEADGENAALNLSMSLAAVMHMSLNSQGEEKQLDVPESLFIPFSGDFSDSVRALLKTGSLSRLAENIQQQRNVMFRHGAEVYLRND